jgi:hypothetical protein
VGAEAKVRSAAAEGDLAALWRWCSADVEPVPVGEDLLVAVAGDVPET